MQEDTQDNSEVNTSMQEKLRDFASVAEHTVVPQEHSVDTDAVQGEEKNVTSVTYVQKIDAQGRAYATGKRKNAIARVWVSPGKGKITVNNKDQDAYFGRSVLKMIVKQPFEVVDSLGQYDVRCTVVGGGFSGQAGAIRHGISKALVNYNPELRKALKSVGFLTRDSRVVERKKYGKAKARKSFQFSKR